MWEAYYTAQVSQAAQSLEVCLFICKTGEGTRLFWELTEGGTEKLQAEGLARSRWFIAVPLEQVRVVFRAANPLGSRAQPSKICDVLMLQRQPGCRVCQSDFGGHPPPLPPGAPGRSAASASCRTPAVRQGGILVLTSTGWVRNLRCLAQHWCSIEFSCLPSLPRQKSPSEVQRMAYFLNIFKNKRGKNVVLSFPLEAPGPMCCWGWTVTLSGVPSSIQPGLGLEKTPDPVFTGRFYISPSVSQSITPHEVPLLSWFLTWGFTLQAHLCCWMCIAPDGILVLT